MVRGTLGDVLAAMLVYCGLRGLLAMPPHWAGALAMALGVLIEAMRAIQQADRLGLGLGLRPGSAASIARGNTATPRDLMLYLSGIGITYIWDVVSLRSTVPAGSASPP